MERYLDLSVLYRLYRSYIHPVHSLLHLVLDYWYLKDYHKAEYYLNQLIEDKNQIDWAAPYLIKIEEQKGEGNKALDI